MIDALARLAPLAIELMHARNYANGGYARGGYNPRHFAEGGGMDGQQPQHNQNAPMQQEGSPNGGATQYVQQEPDLNAPQGEPMGAPMAPYAHGGYAHPHHYMHGGHAIDAEGHYSHGGYAEGGEGHYSGGQLHHYAQGGPAPAGHHMPHYAFGGAFKGAYQAANGMRPQAQGQPQQRPMMNQRPQMGLRRIPMGAGPHQQRPAQQQQMPQPPQAIEPQQPQQEMQAARHGGHMPRRAHGGALYPYVR